MIMWCLSILRTIPSYFSECQTLYIRLPHLCTLMIYMVYFVAQFFCFVLLANNNVLTIKNGHKLHQKQPTPVIDCFY